MKKSTKHLLHIIFIAALFVLWIFFMACTSSKVVTQEKPKMTRYDRIITGYTKNGLKFTVVNDLGRKCENVKIGECPLTVGDSLFCQDVFSVYTGRP